MHALFSLVGMLVLIHLGSAILNGLSCQMQSWTQRRWLYITILALPFLAMIMLVSGLCHIFNPLCFLNHPGWEQIISSLMRYLIEGLFFGAVGLGIVRLLLMRYSISRQSCMRDPLLQERINAIAEQHHLAQLPVRVCRSDRPLALTFGVWRPQMLLSTWMIKHLDQQELEAVLIHELEHVKHRDFLVNWIALVLRDAFFYLPTSRNTYRQFAAEKEVACDDFAVHLTHRPLALASALAKVWLSITEETPYPLAQALVRTHDAMKGRIERLLLSDISAERSVHRLDCVKGALAAMFIVVLISMMALLVLIGCRAKIPFIS